MSLLNDQIIKLLNAVGVKDEIELTIPPKSEMGDLAFGCFEIAKERGENPKDVAEGITDNLKFKILNFKLLEKVEVFGPYINFFLNPQELAKIVLENIDENIGKNDIGKGKKILVEFGCPNPLKVFHLGHLKNLITGESIVRVFENAGYDVVRVNYQGDVGMHVAKAMWGIYDLKDDYEEVKEKSIEEKLEFLGCAYSHGASQFEKDENIKKEIIEYNKKVYSKDASIKDIYETTRAWSLDYFDTIYKKLGSHFDQLYFESEVWERGLQLVNNGLKKEVFKKSYGAVIFEGSKYGFHDRVFINSEGYPTYEAKDMGLGERHFKDHHPDNVIHVVGKEQAGYFQVVFKALEQVVPESKDKESHLVGGYLQLKGEKKMSSRLGNVISGEDLLNTVETKVREIMKDSELNGKDDVIDKIVNAVLKYAMLKSDVSQDVAFDMDDSISFSGDSGPYLLYIVARIKSILEKGERGTGNGERVPENISSSEKQLLLQLAKFNEVTKRAVEEMDPSKIAQYLFDLAQDFNNFYHECPVIKSGDDVRDFRIRLVKSVEIIMTKGLYLLGIETVDSM